MRFLLDKRKRVFVIFTTLVIIFCVNSYAQDITLSGRWDLDIDENDLLGGAGSDLNSTYESNATQIRVRIRNSNYKWWEDWFWKVEITKSDVNWHSNFHLDVQRTSDGIGIGGSISGLTSYEEIFDIDPTPPTFTGVRNRTFVYMQYRLRGVSLQIPADEYETIVIYTLTEL